MSGGDGDRGWGPDSWDRASWERDSSGSEPWSEHGPQDAWPATYGPSNRRSYPFTGSAADVGPGRLLLAAGRGAVAATGLGLLVLLLGGVLVAMLLGAMVLLGAGVLGAAYLRGAR